jgi:hypothetical protein
VCVTATGVSIELRAADGRVNVSKAYKFSTLLVFESPDWFVFDL